MAMIRCRAARSLAAGESSFTGRRAEGRRPRQAPAPREQPLARQPPEAQKLLVIVVADVDADSLVRALVQRRHATTKIGSTGGFLRRGNTTLLCGVPAAAVDEVLVLVRQLCPARSEPLPLGALPLAGELPFITEPAEVRVGGAVVFVLNVERFERV